MKHRTHFFIALFILNISLFSPVIYADRAASIDALFGWAEEQYPDLFSPSSPATQSIGEWTYRHYSETETYAGVNTQDEAYVMGGSFGNTPVFIDNLNTLLNAIGYIQVGGEILAPDDVVNAGTGECASIPLIAANSGYTLESKTFKQGQLSMSSFREITVSHSDDHYKRELVTTTSDRFKPSSKVIETNHVIVNNMLYKTREATIRNSGTAEETKSTNSWSPALLTLPANKFCEGANWRAGKVSKTFISSTGQSSTRIEKVVFTGEVLSINESTTVPAGTFKTVLIKLSDPELQWTVAQMWIDIATGLPVKFEYYDFSGIIGQSEELINIF